MIFKPYSYDATGCAAYLFGCGGKGLCAVVDAHEEDVEAYAAFAAQKSMRITHVIDTHVQADHRSGGRALAAHTGSTMAAERRWNPLLSLPREDFVRELTRSVPAKPAESEAIIRFNQGRGP